MAKVELSKRTIAELKKEATTEDKDGWPVIETIDSVILRLIQEGKLGNGKRVKITKLPKGGVRRKHNPDNLSKFIRDKYQGLPNYREMALRVFAGSGNERLGLSSIVNMIFIFPNTAEKKDRQFRATRSIQVAMRQYAGGKKLFDEPIKDIFELSLKK